MVSETIRARVDRSLARRVKQRAKEDGSDVSSVVRLALERLLDEDDRIARIEEARRKFREAQALGLFDPPTEPWKAGGFR